MRQLSPIFALLFLLACGSDEDFDTQRDAVIAICDTLCDKATECGENIPDCSNACVGELCQATVCSAEFAGSDDDLNQCLDDIDELACEAEVLPGSCNDVL